MIQTPLYTSQQAIEIDKSFVAANPQAGYDLMRRAGQRVAAVVIESFPGRQQIIVCCGSGNNGGDGYVAARRLLQLGLQVSVVAVTVPTSASCQRAAAEFVQAGGEVTDSLDRIDRAVLVIDAMLGAGISRPPAGRYADAIARCNASAGAIVAVDMPSGVNGSSGAVLESAVGADITVTFIVRKVGLYTGQGKALAGDLIHDDLGVEPRLAGVWQPRAQLTRMPVLGPRPADSHKGHFGRVAVLGGDAGMAGAVILAARAALRGGAGLVLVGSVSGHQSLVTQATPELMTAFADTDDQIAALVSASDVAVCGPGTGQGDWCRQLLHHVLQSDRAGVIDAGALRCLGERGAIATGKVLTPHPGEAAALLGCSTAEVQRDRCAAAEAIARRYDAIAVVKGAGTVVSDGKQIEICAAGNPGMASAGMGDVLAGLIGALLAQGMASFEAACGGVHLHAVAADNALKQQSEQTMIASDIIEELATAFRC